MTILQSILASYQMTMSDEETRDYQQLIQDEMFESYEHVAQLPEQKLPVKYKRSSGYRPEKEENPLNAWYWKTTIEHAPHGRLEGKRIALKDNISVAGIPMMNGSKVLEGFIPDIDAIIVTRILDEAGEIAGKAVCESFCCDCSSFTSDTGPVLNPYNTTCSAGGSSSGSAVLVATGQVDMAIGCDQTGSIRMPSSWCGILGLKPTWGLVPYTGIFSVDRSLDHCGPMARTSQELAMLLDVIAGPDVHDPRSSLQKPSIQNLDTGIKGLRIGIVNEGFNWPCSDEQVDNLVVQAAQSLTEKEAVVDYVSIPWHRHGIHIANIINTEGTAAQMFAGHSLGTGWHGYYQTELLDTFVKGMQTKSDALSAAAKLTLLTGQYMQQTYNGKFYAKAQNLGNQLKDAYNRALNDFDVLVMPTVPYTATKLPEKKASLAEQIKCSFGVDTNTGAFDVTGHPALSIPCGLIKGLPVGMMVVGRFGEEGTLLKIANAYEQLTDYAYTHPVREFI